jgi:nitroimidazol reductase NimA-like FMN-containing flavoprotein (pyridoxamine 5'-phosphate oxidase superfamily)
MHRKISFIRDLELIEQELNDSSGGIFAFNIDGEKVIQHVTTFLYLDKNIYFFLEKDDEIYEKLNFNSFASFTVVKDEKLKKGRTKESSYYLFSATVVGSLKVVEEKKTIEDVKSKYLNKYSLKKSGDTKTSHLKELVMIDSEEIQAVEEEGS